MSGKHAISFMINGVACEAAVPSRLTLADFLREELELTGTHVGCEHGACGACAVLVDGEAMLSCCMLAVQAHGRSVTTIEGVANEGQETGDSGGSPPLSKALQECHGVQCGFCTPGVVVCMTALLAENPEPSEAEIRRALAGNLCRCTGYQGIVDAVLSCAGRSD